MRMYLSSFDLGACPQRLVSLAGHGKRAAIILNALDHREQARAQWRQSQTAKLTALGFAVQELDLRKFFGSREALNGALAQVDLVWINGGNAFLLRRAMKQSGFDVLIADVLHRDRIVYAGFSAAAVIASDTLRALDHVSDPSEVAPGYDPAVIVPTHDTDHASDHRSRSWPGLSNLRIFPGPAPSLRTISLSSSSFKDGVRSTPLTR